MRDSLKWLEMLQQKKREKNKSEKIIKIFPFFICLFQEEYNIQNKIAKRVK